MEVAAYFFWFYLLLLCVGVPFFLSPYLSREMEQEKMKVLYSLLEGLKSKGYQRKHCC